MMRLAQRAAHGDAGEERLARQVRSSSVGVRGGDVVPSEPDTVLTQGPDESDRIADRDQLERGFRRLTPDQRAVLVLQYYVGLSLAEIADVLGIPIGTAGSRIHHASRALRAALDADDRTESPKERTA